MTFKEFLEQPNDSCRTILSLGYPNSGKTYNMVRCLMYWLQSETFAEVHLVLPVYKYEQKNTYGFLENYRGKTKIFVYNGYHEMMARKLLEQQKKKGSKPIFLGIDDSTHQKSELMKSEVLTEIATTSRHLKIHTWLIMHYNKGIIPPNVRQNLGFIFVFCLSKKAMENIFEEYNQNNKFESFKEFFPTVSKKYTEDKFACLLIDNIHKVFNFNVSTWWQDKGQ